MAYNYSMTQNDRAVLWDLDGTLIDSGEYHWQAWRDTLAQENIILARDRFDASFGQRSEAALRNYLAPELPPGEIVRVCLAKAARYRELIGNHGAQLMPGAAQWLNALKAGGWRQALATSAPRIDVEAILSSVTIGGYFEAIVTSEDVERGKPDPAVFLTAAARVKVAPARCIVVEDAPAGLEAARRAGMRSIGLLSSQKSLKADIAISSFDQLPQDAFERLLAD
jgi:HAD superfamily hydrolase (TIGR01509 family)